MVRDWQLGELRKGVASARDSLKAHRQHCGQCQRAKREKRPEHMCAEAWRLVGELRQANRLVDDHKQAQAEAASDQGELF